MLRSAVLRASSSGSSLSATRASSIRALRPAITYTSSRHEHQNHQGHAISNPTLANIESRWDSMPPQEQADLWMSLRDRMKNDWHELTLQEKKASYWIAFGPHGPRALPDPNMNWKVFKGVVYMLIASSVVFYITRYLARPPPKTMTKEWQEASNEYAKKNQMEPITGVSSEGYKGKGFVQSKPSGKKPEELAEAEE